MPLALRGFLFVASDNDLVAFNLLIVDFLIESFSKSQASTPNNSLT